MQERRLSFSTGETFTIISGLFVAACIVFAIGVWKSKMEDADASLMKRVEGLHTKVDGLDTKMTAAFKDTDAAIAAMSARLPIQKAQAGE